jgi:hypothetical protein
MEQPLLNRPTRQYRHQNRWLMHLGWIALSVLLVMVIGTGGRADPGAAVGPPTVDVPPVPGTDSLDDLANAQLSGGPRPDGIPAIDDPGFFSSVADANRFLDPKDIVFGIVRNGEARAYPQRILVWHEIVNDVVGGEPLAITYCPLTGTAIGFKRGSTTFGVSGMLVNSNLVMFDRATASRWPQVLGRAIEGDHAGNRLEEFPVIWTTWERWRQAYPETRVLSDRTGFVRNYNRDPYGRYNPRGGYYTSERTLFPVRHSDDRLPRKAVVIGARTPDGAIAFLKERVRQEGTLHGEVGGVNYTAEYLEPLDTAVIVRNPKRAQVDIRGPFDVPDGEGQERVNVLDAMWFAWHAFYPESTLVD